ncbi:uncharacterized protein CLAFUR5_06484 [Fulvia fulva]|uniref:DUF2428 domain-containing protein n=1 Tax=Passalora fulva TaxID=5499 RepID=A0A9Q8P8S0_PASFU|nr:uncharacterized protein CLAFUR5_06484 [Fulvia fulva]UJO17504.1 hypothetical protein CLAFUR5_06484 [Fulvia fulva]WPV29816.1 hypothetical protein CLAFUW7_06338 [Fulvia fulva]
MSVATIEVHASHDSILPEERLKLISKSSRSLIPNESSSIDNINAFKRLLDHVFATSSAPGLSAPHRVAAWNTLCCLIDQSLSSSCSDLQQPEWISKICSRAFYLYLEHAQTAKPKSSKQLLGTLTTALRSREEEDFVTLRRTVLTRLMQCLTDYQAPHAAKAGAQLLGQLLLKDIVASSDILDVFGSKLGTDAQESTLTEEFCYLLEILFKWLSSGDFGSSVSQLVAILLDKFRQDRTVVETEPSFKAQQCPIWVAPLQATLFHGAVGIDDLRAHILPVLFKRSFRDFVSFLDAQGFWSNEAARKSGGSPTRSEAQDDLLFASLQTGKELGLLVETDDGHFSQAIQPIRVPVRWMGEQLCRKSRSARLTGLSLLTTSHAATRPIPTTALTQIRRALPSMFADVDADFRSGVLSAFQRLIDRLRAITAVLARQKHTNEGAQSNQSTTSDGALLANLRAHEDFVRWALRFVTWELRPTASYQRHISALKCLAILARSGLDTSVPSTLWSRTALGESKWPFTMTIMSDDLKRLLLDIVIDPFDDVRQAATTILDMQASTTPELNSATRRAETDMLRTGRADHADGVARIYALRSSFERAQRTAEVDSPETSIVHDLVGQLEKMLEVARSSLPEAVSKYPLHGILTSLRYVLVRDTHAMMKVTARLSRLLGDVWEVVKPVLCNDAPEGFALEEQEETIDSTKETLSYCWRALKEASLLLSTLVAQHSSDRANVNADLTLRLSNLCFTQLAELRHRGAFSTVAQSWITCCTECKDMKANGESLLNTWYLKVLDMLRRNITINTRRSAGLPALLCGILIADSSHGLLSSAVADLKLLSRQKVDPAAAEEGSLAQVHAMNCLKDILKNSKLGEQSEPYIAVAFQLAADSLRSGVWAIRNCGLMLFRAVVDRILKTDQSHFDDDFQSSRSISTEQYPALLDTVIGLLPSADPEADATHTRFEGVFAALQLLQHIRIPTARIPQIKDAIRPLISSTSWHMRDKAARTWTSVMHSRNVGEAVIEVGGWLSGASDDSDQNYMHGILLASKYVVRVVALQSERCNPSSTRGKADHRPNQVGMCRAMLAEVAIYRDHIKRKASQHPVVKAASIDLVAELSQTLVSLHDDHDGDKYHAHREVLDLWSSADHPDLDAAMLFRMLLAECLVDPNAAVLRQSIARFMAQQMSLIDLGDKTQSEMYAQQVVQLADHDENACKDFLHAIKGEHTRSNSTMARFAIRICRSILDGAMGTELKCEALELLLYVYTGSQNEGIDSQTLFTGSLDYLSIPVCNQRYADLCLRYRAAHLDQRCATSSGAGLEGDVTSWVSDCASAISGQGVYTREAATQSIGLVRSLWSFLKQTPNLHSSLLDISLAVYDLLNDDDEEIRLSAAITTSRVLASDLLARHIEHEPIAASQELLAFITKRWNKSQDLAAKALERAFQWSPRGPRAVTEHLQLSSRGDSALFAEEKQNLYVDDAKEVRAWTQVLTRLSPYAMPRGSIAILAEWVMASLDALQGQAENKSDGALGWSSNPDTFILGLRVIYGAEVLLSLSRRGMRLPVKPSQIRRRLHACDTAYETTGVNCLWRWETHRILGESVLHKVQMTASLVRYTAQR